MRGGPVPPIFLDQLVHLILRNALDQCDDAYMLRAAELFFRPQRLTVHDGSLLAADEEHIDANATAVSPLVAMFGLPAGPEIEVLSDDNASDYWDRSDRFDLALDLTAGRRGLAALGTVIVRWVKHLLDIDIMVEPLNELRDTALAWYVGLDANGTKIGDALWNGTEIDDATRDTDGRTVPADVLRRRRRNRSDGRRAGLSDPRHDARQSSAHEAAEFADRPAGAAFGAVT